jgi:hypothetical protein
LLPTNLVAIFQVPMFQKQSPKTHWKTILDKLSNLGISAWIPVILEVANLSKNLARKFQKSGIYQVLEHETKVTLHDIYGKHATVNKRQKVKFLQNNVIAFQDQAWGDGEVLLNYKCSPGVPSDIYRIEHKKVVLISLRKEYGIGDLEEFNIEWDIKNGFPAKVESWGTEIIHPTNHLKVTIIFPPTRPPTRAFIIQSNNRKYSNLNFDDILQLPDGRWQLKWENRHLNLNESYTLEWYW